MLFNMEKKILKYNQFLNENIFSGIGDGIKSFLMGAKRKIQAIIDEMVSIEKDFIDKTDELTLNIHTGQYDSTKGKMPYSYSPLLKQREAANKRALNALERSKNSQIKAFQNEIEDIVDGNKRLVDFYNERAVIGDKEIADYNYQITKRYKGGEFSTEYKHLSDLRNSLGSTKVSGGVQDPDGEIEKIIKISSFELSKPFTLVWSDFVNYIKDKPIDDLVYWKNNGQTQKFRGHREFEKIDNTIKASIKKIESNKDNNPSAAAEIEILQGDRENNARRMEEFQTRMNSKIELLQKAIKKQSESK